MGKKKPSLKPVQRGIATTSVASKKVVEEAEQDKEATSPEVNSEPTAEASSSLDPVNGGQQANGTSKAEGWEDEETAERFELQGFVNLLQEKAKKDVSRIIKTIEFDTRLSKTFSRLTPHSVIRDRILEFALEEDERELPNSRPSSVGDKELATTYISYSILSSLGFQESRIWECMARVCPSGGWEECLEWLWLHCSEDECLRQGEFAWKPGKAKIRVDDPLVATREVVEEKEDQPRNSSREPPSKLDPITVPDAALPEDRSLFRSLDDSSDSEPDLDPSSINEKWANLRIEVDTLKANAKFKTESAAVTRLKETVVGLEKEYHFDRKQADAIYRTKKAQRHAASVRDRLNGKLEAGDGTASRTESPVKKSAGSSALDSGDVSDDEGMLGNLMDIAELAVEDARQDEGSANTTITVKSMALPTQSNFSAASPKAMLQAAVKRYSKNAILTYAKLSGGSRAVRAGLEVRFASDHIRVWRMVDIACENRLEAENYVATLALHELYADGHLELPNWRVMPPAYRDLWGELEEAHLAKRNEEDLALWKRIRNLLTDLPIAPTADPISRANTETVAVEGAAPRPRDMKRTVTERIRCDFESRQQSARYQKMLLQRNQLPIAGFREEILQTIDSSRVMVLSGETGCGKSTQLPSFILEQELAAGRDCKIIVTEPRRISAISLADRVSQELGDAPRAIDSGSSLVGYSIRLESKISAATKLAFVTNGIALRMLEKGTSGGATIAFDDVTHIVVDEVHERSIESDFLLIALRSLIKMRKDLKIILMSATLDAEKLSNYFGGCPYLSVPGRTFPVTVNHLEDAVELCGWRIDEYSQYAIRHRNRKTGGKQLEWTEDGARTEGSDSDSEDDPTKLSANKYSPDTVGTVNLLDSRQIPYDLIVLLLEQICFRSPELAPFSAAILVFLPGLAEIRKLNDIISSHPAFNMADFVVYPLHSTISSEGQSAVFDIPPPGVRKIVLSTNIAETGVTIPDITCVIDSGKHREMRYDEKRQLSRLIETYISRSNAKQRRGRAGRVREGIAFHLFTKARHDAQMAEHPIPEMLRLSLQDLALRIKILDFGSGSSIEGVLSKALDPPSSLNIQRAIAALVEVKALNAAEGITPLGRLLSKLPLDVHLGNFLLVACIYRCLDPALTIVATLNAKSPFIAPFGHESAADAAKAAFAVGNSDFLTLVNVFDAWRRVSTSQESVRVFCRRNYLSQQNLQQIEESRRQLLSYLIDSGFVEVSPAQRKEISNARFGRGFRTNFITVPPQLNEQGYHHGILGSALAAGLYPRILSHEGKGAFKSVNNQQIIAIHPTSVNRRLQSSSLQTSHMVYYTIMQSKRLYAWETGPVDDIALAILCGDQADVKLAASSLQIDRKIKYQIDGKSALAINLLRQNLATITANRYRGSALSPAQQKWFDLSVEWLKTITSS